MKKIIFYLLSFLIILSVLASAELSKDIWGVWTFNEDVGYSANEGGWEWVNTNTLNVSGKNDHGIDFTSGASCLASINSTVPKDFTVNLWVNYTSVVGMQRIINKYDDDSKQFMYYSDGNSHYLSYSTNGANDNGLSMGTIDTGKYYMITLRFNYSETTELYGIDLFVNATHVNHASNTLFNSTSNWYFGSKGDCSTNPFSGLGDELTIWNKSLTDTYITTLYNDKKGFFYSFNITDDIFPNYNILNNNGSILTKINGVVNFSLEAFDETELSGYIFSNNQTGIFINDDFKSLTGTSAFIDELLNITVSQNNYICGKFYINDTSDNVNETVLSCFTVQNSIPSTPVILSPINNQTNHTININYYAIDFDNDILTYSIYINNTLNITTTDNITNWKASSGTYNLFVSVSDGINISSSNNINFTLDNIIPIIQTTIPNEDNSSEYINNYNITLTSLFTDNRDLYSYNITLYTNNSNIILWNDFSLISGETKSYSKLCNNTLFPNVIIREEIVLCDSHTNKEIKEAYYIEEKYNEIIYNFDGTIIKIRDITNKSIATKTTKEKDRYNFNFQYLDNIPIKKYELISNDIVYLKNSKYKGHFVISNKYWLDFEQKGDVKVFLENDKYTIYVFNNDKNINFKSIGELNCITEHYTFELLQPIIIKVRTTAEAITDFNALVLYSLFIFIQLFFLVLGLHNNNRWVVILSNLMAVFISVSFIRFITINSFFKNSIMIYIFMNIILMIMIIFGDK